MDKEQKNVTQFYGAFAASVICNFIPLAIVQIFGWSLMLAVLIGAYIYKARSKLDSLAYNHMTYIIGTIWIGSLLLFLGMLVATYWVYAQGDHTVIEGLIATVNSGTIVSEAEMTSVLHSYMQQNYKLLMTVTLSTVGPAVLYVVYRTACGLSRASKGYRMAKPAGWL